MAPRVPTTLLSKKRAADYFYSIRPSREKENRGATAVTGPCGAPLKRDAPASRKTFLETGHMQDKGCDDTHFFPNFKIIWGLAIIPGTMFWFTLFGDVRKPHNAFFWISLPLCVMVWMISSWCYVVLLCIIFIWYGIYILFIYCYLEYQISFQSLFLVFHFLFQSFCSRHQVFGF